MSRSFQRASWPSVQRRGRRLGGLYWMFSARDRKRALVHLEIAFPELTGEERRNLGKRSFVQLGVGLAEILHAPEANISFQAANHLTEGVGQEPDVSPQRGVLVGAFRILLFVHG